MMGCRALAIWGPYLQQHIATHRNTLQHTATYCNTLQHIVTHCCALQHTATYCNTLPHTATHCNTLQHTATHCNTLQHTATLCDTLQYSATCCNTLQHTTKLSFDTRSLAHANRAHLMGNRALSAPWNHCRSLSRSCLAYRRNKTIECRGARADSWIGSKGDRLLLVLSYVVPTISSWNCRSYVVNKSLSPVLCAAYHL